MANKSIDVQFNKDWEKAVAFAQLNGVGANAIKSVFNADQQRITNGYMPMSIAERNHALLSAQNPNKVTQVPSDKPDAKSFLGNVRSNLANIFTGLAPNHLIPNVVHSAETAIMHPSSWIDPLQKIAGGIETGNTKQIGQGLEAAGSAGSILSWVPGVYDLGQLAKGGLDALAQQPITAFLDVAPFAPAGRIASLAADGARMETIASKLGMSVDDFKKASMPQMGMAWTLMRPLTKEVPGTDGATLDIVNRFPGVGKLTQDRMRQAHWNPITNEVSYKPVTVGDMLSNWSQKLGGLSKAAAGIGAASMQAQILGTDAEMYGIVPYAQAMKNLGEAGQKQVQDLVNDPTKSYADVMNDNSLDEGVRNAYSMGKDLLGFLAGETLADGRVAMVHGPAGVDEAYVSDGEGQTMVALSTKKREALINVIKELGPNNRRFNAMEESNRQLSLFSGYIDDRRKAAQQAPVDGFTAPVYTDFTRAGKPKAPISLDRARQRDVLTADKGIVSQISEQLSAFSEDGTPKAVDPVTALHLTRAAIKRLEYEGYGAILHTTDTSLSELYGALQGLKGHLEERVKIEDRFTKDLLEMRSVRRAPKRDVSGAKPKRRPTEPSTKDPAAWQRYQRRLAAFEGRSDEGLTPVAVVQGTRVSEALKELSKADAEFKREWWRRPSDAWRNVEYDGRIDKIVDMMNRTELVGDTTAAMRRSNFTENEIRKYQENPKLMAEWIYNETKHAASNADGIPILTKEEMEAIYNSGVDHADTLRMQGHSVQWVPVVSDKDIKKYDAGRYGVRPGISQRRLTSTLERNRHEFTPQRYDLLAQIHIKTKEVIEHNNAVEFVANQLAPHAKGAGEVRAWAQKVFPTHYGERDPGVETELNLVEGDLEKLGLVQWDYNRRVGFGLPQWKGEAIYLPKTLADATNSLLSHKGFPMDGVYDRATNLFRFSILGLSPRYTAHIVFGGAFLLALRSDPTIVLRMGKAFAMTKDPTHMPVAMRQVSAERGVQPAEYRTVQTTKWKAPTTPQEAGETGLEAYHMASGGQQALTVVQEDLAKQDVDWQKANPVQWLKAVGDLNYRFTRRVSTMYRAASMLDYAAKAEKRGFYEELDPATGKLTRYAMTPERARHEGVQHALKVMGDLQHMSPLERATFMRIMPFYGWTRHILQYVLTYPVDHPYRAQFLAVQATMDSDEVAKALDTRIQFLFNLGTPDAMGNVKAVDVRFMDPLRDTANYASLSGWIGALNPALTAPLTAIDPNLVYANTSLYPNVTYNQLYGIETSAPQGNPLTAVAKQFVPQIGALDAAYQAATSYRSLATTNPTQFYKTVFQALNIPFAQVQDINYKQRAAKGEEARYNVAKTAAKNAWSSPGMGGTGIIDALKGFGAVPNPLNVDAGDITPAQLQQIYNAALAAYPGQNPADVVTAPPNAPGY